MAAIDVSPSSTRSSPVQGRGRRGAGASLTSGGGIHAGRSDRLVDPVPHRSRPQSRVSRHRDHTRHKFGPQPCFSAGAKLLRELGGVGDERRLRPIDPTTITTRADEWQARLCYALALPVEPLRAYTIEGSRLMSLDRHAGTPELLKLANDDEITDLVVMRDLARSHLVPALPPGPVATGPTFEGSADLNADADLIAGGMLIDIKASQGGPPRKDGTRAASLSRNELDQLIGYTLMDYSDTFHIHSLALYPARFGHLAAWPVEELLAQLAGHPGELDRLRDEFKNILQVDLPQYWQGREPSY